MKVLVNVAPLPAFVAGLLLGLVVTGFTDVLMRRSLSAQPAKKGTLDKRLVLTFLLKYGLDITALFLVYRNVAMLLGVALGLSVSVLLQVKRAQEWNSQRAGQVPKGGRRQP